MSLLEQQNFLARLYTDENLRRAFLSEPEKIGQEYDLTEKEIAELARILPEELNFFADSLRWKRRGEVKKLLPQTLKILDEDFENHFRKFANQFQPATIKKHLEDAIEFCSFLQKADVKPLWIKDLAKFERALLIFNSNAKSFVFEKFEFDIREIIKEISRQDAKAQSDFKRRKTFAVWVRIGKRTKHFIF